MTRSLAVVNPSTGTPTQPAQYLATMSTSSVFAAATPHPANLNHPARDEYHGVVVMDPYRWLEDGNDPAVKAWTHAQNRRTRDHLDAIAICLIDE
jgi:prolyl oligopeptidase